MSIFMMTARSISIRFENPSNIRRLQNLVHSLGTQGTLHQVTNGDGTNEGRQTGILALLLDHVVRKDLCGIAE